MATMTAAAAVKEFHKRTKQGKTVTAGGKVVKHVARGYAGVDFYNADGTQTRVAAGDNVTITNATDVRGAHEKTQTSTPWQSKVVDTVAVAANAS